MSDSIPQGYKMTEVAIIPDDWDEVVLECVTEKVGSGITPRGGSNVYQAYGRPFVRSQNVGWGTLSLEDLAFISDEIHATFDATEIQLDDVFLNITGASIGRSAIADERVVNGNVNQHVCIIRTISDKLHPRYLNYFLLSNMGQSQIDSFQAGGNRQGLNFGQIKSFRLVLPPTLTEQRAIADALSDVDAQITALDEAITKKRDLKQGAMQRLLTGEERLPGFSGEWEVKRLGEIAEIISGGTPKTTNPEYWNGGILWCTPTDITGTSGKYLFTTERTISLAGLQNSSAQLLPSGTLLLCSRATIGEVKIAGDEICTNQGFKSLICHENVSNEYLYYLILTMKPQMIEIAIGSTFLELPKKAAANLEIKIPSYDEQQAIAAVLSDMDAEINTLEAQREKTVALKQGMMQELLTGKTRLL